MLLDSTTVRQLRELKAYTYRKLAQKSGVSRSLLFYVEKDKRNITEQTEEKLLKAFGIRSEQDLKQLLDFYELLHKQRRENENE